MLEIKIANPIESPLDALTETQELRTIYCHGPGRKNCLLPNRLKEMKIEKITLLSISAATISSWIWTICGTVTWVYVFSFDFSILFSQFSFYSEDLVENFDILLHPHKWLSGNETFYQWVHPSTERYAKVEWKWHARGRKEKLMT